MKGKVQSLFRDKHTGVFYKKGDVYEGDPKRLKELSELGFIEVQAGTKEEAAYPIHTGGGWYELSNGEKVQGKDDAQAAEQALAESGE